VRLFLRKTILQVVLRYKDNEKIIALGKIKTADSFSICCFYFSEKYNTDISVRVLYSTNGNVYVTL